MYEVLFLNENLFLFDWINWKVSGKGLSVEYVVQIFFLFSKKRKGVQ